MNNFKAFHSASNEHVLKSNNWTLIGAHCRYLISTLNKNNYRSHISEIAQLEKMCEVGIVDQFTIRCLIKHIDWKDIKQKDAQRIQFLTQKISQIATQPNFASLICQALELISPLPIGFVKIFSGTLKLTKDREIALAVAMAQTLTESAQKQGEEYLKEQIPIYVSEPEGNKLADSTAHNLLNFIQGFTNFPNKEKIIEAFSKNYGNNTIFAPVLAADPTRNDSKRNWKVESRFRQSALIKELSNSFSPAELMEDLGYTCCANLQSFKKLLKEYPTPLSPLSIAEIVGMMMKPRNESSDELVILQTDNGEVDKLSNKKISKWNTKVFASTIMELYPNLDWSSVIEHLDYPDFKIYDQDGLELILNIHNKISGSTFPVSTLFRKWKNVDGQLSFIKAGMFAPIDVFCFPASSEIMNELYELQLNVAPKSEWVIHNFYSLPLVKTLLQISTENVSLYADIAKLFDEAMEKCPKVLLLGLSLITDQQHCVLKVTLMNELLEKYFNPENKKILAEVWKINKRIILHTMEQYYSRDPLLLVDILSIAQELDILRDVLINCALTNFAIDLAALASVNGKLNLSAWLEEMIAEHGDIFCGTTVSFLKDRITQQQFLAGGDEHRQSMESMDGDMLMQNSQLSGGNSQDQLLQMEFGKESHSVPLEDGLPSRKREILSPSSSKGEDGESKSKFVTLRYETVQVFLDVLRNATASMSPDVNMAFKQLLMLLESEVFPSDIEQEANSIFSRIYDNEMSIEEIIHLLRAFKVSNNQRERNIFQCMIRSLYAEYNHIPKYPEKELQITGVLFGSLIQHLGILCVTCSCITLCVVCIEAASQ